MAESTAQQKRCAKCGIEKERPEFYQRGGRTTQPCKVCRRSERNARTPVERARQAGIRRANQLPLAMPPERADEMFKCETCGATKKRTEFRHRRTTKSPLGWRMKFCRDCEEKRRKVYRKTSAGKAAAKRQHERRKQRGQTYPHNRKTRLRLRYGLTPEGYDELFTRQGGVCAICGEPQEPTTRHGVTSTALSVDHDHATGKVRGLLCNRHNRGLGFFDDDPDLLLKAVAYLHAAEKRG
jgi:hypothetical protein